MKALLLLLSLLLAAGAPAAAPADREGYLAADDGTRIFYRIEGAGPETLVVVHGGPGNSMESIRPDLASLARGRRVIYYDQRGNGRSQLVGDDRLGLDRHIADLEALRRHFGLERMSLLGNSWGGLLVSAYAAAHPDRVELLVLDASAPPARSYLEALGNEFGRRARIRMTADQQRRLRFVFDPANWMAADDPLAICHDFEMAVLRLYAFDPDAHLSFGGDLCAGSREAVRRQQVVNQAIWASMGDFDFRQAVASVRAPVLVVHGTADAVPAAASRDWAASFANARLLTVPRTGHLIHIERPEIFFPAVEAFLAGGWPDGAEAIRPRRAPSASEPSS